jgi:(p)ppGpp synthase/HD superfamily hydrolase
VADRLTRAIEIAAQVHRGQTDKSGVPYIRHALKVMEMAEKRCLVLGMDGDLLESAMCVAVLHDAIEDFAGTPIERGVMLHAIEELGNNVSVTLAYMTKEKGEDYLGSYIERVAQNTIARIVKICDLTHNMDPRRLPLTAIEEKDLDRWHKYRQAERGA